MSDLFEKVRSTILEHEDPRMPVGERTWYPLKADTMALMSLVSESARFTNRGVKRPQTPINEMDKICASLANVETYKLPMKEYLLQYRIRINNPATYAASLLEAIANYAEHSLR